MNPPGPLAIARRSARLAWPPGRAALASVASTLLFLALLPLATLSGCGVSPWEQDEVNGPAAADSTPQVFSAESASIGEWRDERSSGLVIRHGMLVVDDPRLATGPTGGRSAIVVTGGGALYRKVRDILEDRVPVASGMKTNFALGETVSVKIERVEPDGRRETIGEGRVSFLELVRR